LKRFGDLYPKVNRTKNVSRSTAHEYLRYRPGSKLENEVRTVDIEVLYGQEGVQVGGMCEMRSSWKFNELKPRFYYAQGCRDYFASRYIKKFATALMESITATKVDTRRNPDHYVVTEPDDFIVAWDLTAFTSSLHELRFFLYWITRAIEDRGDVSISIVDYREGKKIVSAVEMLDSYNDIVNINSPFTILRIIDKFGLHEEFDHDHYEQQNSGMLGVAGNIGFSTANHGYAIDQVNEPSKNVSVGDDALSSIKVDPDIELFPQIEKIGTLERSKTSIIPPYEEGPLKFVKRALYRGDDGLFIDFLLKLPLPVLIDERYGNRSPPDFDDYKRTKIVATTVGALIWDLTTHWQELTDHDITLLTHYLQMTYHSLHLSPDGGLPGSPLYINGQRIRSTYAYPPIPSAEFSPFQTDWLEFLMDQQVSYNITLPKLSPSFQAAVPDPGEEYCCTIEPTMKVLEDLGHIEEMGMVTEEVIFLTDANKRTLRAAIKKDERGLKPVYRYRCINDIPEHFHYAYAPIYEVPYLSILGAL
jgi:hypothetical protein